VSFPNSGKKVKSLFHYRWVVPKICPTEIFSEARARQEYQGRSYFGRRVIHLFSVTTYSAPLVPCS
jgi:hypothetical protein